MRHFIQRPGFCNHKPAALLATICRLSKTRIFKLLNKREHSPIEHDLDNTFTIGTSNNTSTTTIDNSTTTTDASSTTINVISITTTIGFNTATASTTTTDTCSTTTTAASSNDTLATAVDKSSTTAWHIRCTTETSTINTYESEILPPTKHERCQYLLSHLVKLSSVATSILLEDDVIFMTGKWAINSGDARITGFSYKDRLYLWVQKPDWLVKAITDFRWTMPWCRDSTRGVCAVEELWYLLNRKRGAQVAKCTSIFRAIRRLFTSSVRERCENADYMEQAKQAFSFEHPADWACRFVWSLFLFVRYESFSHSITGYEHSAVLIDAIPGRFVVTLCFSCGIGDVVLCDIPWNKCSNIRSCGISFTGQGAPWLDYLGRV